MVQSKGLAPGVDPRAIAALKRVGGTTLQTDVTVVLEDTVCTLAFRSHPLKVRDFYDRPQVKICTGLKAKCLFDSNISTVHELSVDRVYRFQMNQNTI